MQAAQKRQQEKGRILHPQPATADHEEERERYFGATATAKRITLNSDAKDFTALRERVPIKATNELLRWFLGDHLLDHEVPLDVLLAFSKRKLFYVWPSLSTLHLASSMSVPDFVDACVAEWESMRGITGPSILEFLDQERWDRLGKNQVRVSLGGHPSTLTKAVDLLALISRLLLQNDLPAKGCILPSIYVLTFNGVIAGDGVVERMLLTGMAGNLQTIADNEVFPIRLIQSAIRGGLLPYDCASNISSMLNGTILKKTKLRCATSLADPDFVAKQGREAADLSVGTLAERFLVPRKAGFS